MEGCHLDQTSFGATAPRQTNSPALGKELPNFSKHAVVSSEFELTEQESAVWQAHSGDSGAGGPGTTIWNLCPGEYFM